jgi:hypothetical protein
MSLPGSCSRSVGYLRTVIPRRHHRCWGLGLAVVAGRGGSDGRGSGGSDNDMFCCGMWLYVLCFWVAMHAVCVLKPGAPAEIT